MGGAIGNMLEFTIGHLLNELVNLGTTFSVLGMTFLSLAVVLALLGGVYSWWLSGSFQDFAAEFVKLFMVVAPLLILFNGWGGYMQSFHKFFHSEIPSALGVAGGNPYQVVGNSLQKLMDSAKMPQDDAPVDPAAGPEQTTADKLKQWWNEKTDMFSMKTLYSLIIVTLAFILNTLLAFGMIFAVFMPLAGLYIGAIFGPLILAWLPWKPLAGMSGKWFGFMIANGITFVVAIVIINAMGGSITYMVTQLQGMSDEGFATGLAGYAVVLVSLFAIYIFALNLMLQANNIATGMTGGATVGEGLFGKLAAAGAAGGMLATGSLAAKAHGKAAGGAVKAAASAPGVMGNAANALGKKTQGVSTAAAISNTKGATKLAGAGNAMRGVGGALNTAQDRINKAGNALSKGADKVKETSTYQRLNKPLKP